MENDYKNLMDEKEYERRFLLHQRFRKVLLIINLLFAIYLVIQLVKVCYREVDNKDKEPSYSLIINDLMNEGEKPYKLRSTPIRDFIVYGDNLSLFYYDYDVTGTNDYYVKEKAKFTFKNLDNNKTYTYRTSLYLDENIYLSSLSVGTYVVFYQEDDILDDMIVTHEAYNKNNEYVLYSLPYKVKDKIMHKKIVIGAIYSNSFPILSIKVSEEKMLSNETFDIAINYDENSKCNSVANKLKE